MKNVGSLISQFRRQALTRLKKGKAIGYFCLYAPPELIESAGYLPVRLAGLGSGTAENEGERYLHNEACSFCKECLGLKRLKRIPYDTVKYVIVPSGCDQMKRHGDKWHLDFKVPTYPIYVPATWEDDSAQNIYWQELKWLDKELQALNGNRKQHTPKSPLIRGDLHFASPLSRGAGGVFERQKPLNAIIALYNEARQRFMRLSSLMSYSEYSKLAHLFFISPVDDFISYLDAIEEAIKNSGDTIFNSQSTKINGELRVVSPEFVKTRLMLVGSPVGYGDNYLQETLAKYPGTDIVYDATCTGHRAFDFNVPMGGDAIADIAAGYFSRPPCIWRRPNSQFYQYIQDIVAKYRIDGVIYKALKFCDVWKYEFKRFKDWMPKPTLFIENTYAHSQDAQISKRVSAFLDMLKQ